LATSKFHSATVLLFEDTMSTLNELKKGPGYCNTVLESADMESEINHASLNLSLELVMNIESRVKELTIKSEHGILPQLSKVSDDVQEHVHHSKAYLNDGKWCTIDVVLKCALTVRKAIFEPQTQGDTKYITCKNCDW